MSEVPLCVSFHLAFWRVAGEGGGFNSFKLTSPLLPSGPAPPCLLPEKDFFIDNLLVRIHVIIVMIRWTGLAPREFELPSHVLALSD